MPTLHRIVASLALALFSAAATAGVAAGVYVASGAGGTLKIGQWVRGVQSFKADSVGPNGHTCGFEGQLAGTIATPIGRVADDCTFRVISTEAGVLLVPQSVESCQHHCGARANWPEAYLRPPTSCLDAERRSQRGKALASYRAGYFEQSVTVLRSLLHSCKEFIHWIESDRMLNDIALAQLKAGDFAGCLHTLKGTLASGVQDEKGFKALEPGASGYLPPGDLLNYLPTARETWWNKALCGRGAAAATR